MSVYDILSDNIQNDWTYKEEFNLNNYLEQSPKNYIKPVPGTIDAMVYYHMHHEPIGESEIKPVLDKIQESIKKTGYPSQEALKEIVKLVKEKNMITIIDNLHSILIEQYKEYNTALFLKFAWDQLMTTKSIEIVKFSLGIIELMDIQKDEIELRSTIRKYACYDEFSLYAIWCMENWTDAQEEIFFVLQHTKGLGAVHALLEIEEMTENQELWVIKNLMDKTYLQGYIARHIYNRCHIYQRLKEDQIQTELIDPITTILSYILEEDEEVSVILMLSERKTLLKNYFNKLIENQEEFTNYAHLYKIMIFLRKNMPEETQYQEIIDTILNSKKAKQTVEKEIIKGKREWIKLADYLDIPCKNTIINLLSQDFNKHIDILDQLFIEKIPPEKITNLIEEHIDLMSIQGPPKEKISTTDPTYCQMIDILKLYKHYPYQGINIVKACLASPYRDLRNLAAKVLSTWQKRTNKLDWARIPQIKNCLDNLLNQSISKEEKETYKKILK